MLWAIMHYTGLLATSFALVDGSIIGRHAESIAIRIEAVLSLFRSFARLVSKSIVSA